jgi:L-fuconolactonase
MQEVGVEGAVVVQARQTVEETRWLLEQAKSGDAIRGVVGWAPIADPDFVAVMEEFEDSDRLCGLRHVLQGESDANYMLRDDFNAGIALLNKLGLVYDVLIYERQLPQTIKFVDRHPQQAFVLDHIAKPHIADGSMEPWRQRIKELAKRQNVSCKISGLVTEANWTAWTPETLKPYLDTVIEAFEPHRLMTGSDWPVCLLASSYARWFDVLRAYFAEFSETERAAIFGETAMRVYKLR